MFELIHSLVHKSRVTLANGLMNLILMLHGEHVTCDSMEDTAEISEDGKSMVINFVFCGTLRSIRIAFDRKRLENNTYIIKDKTGDEIARHISSVPGLDKIIFSKLNILDIYPTASDIIVDESDDY